MAEIRGPLEANAERARHVVKNMIQKVVDVITMQRSLSQESILALSVASSYATAVESPVEDKMPSESSASTKNSFEDLVNKLDEISAEASSLDQDTNSEEVTPESSKEVSRVVKRAPSFGIKDETATTTRKSAIPGPVGITKPGTKLSRRRSIV